MDKYYYLVSQLPFLVFDSESTMTLEIFREEAEKWLTRRDLQILSRVHWKDVSGPQKGPRLWRQYQAFEKQFRNELGMWRRLRKDNQEYRPQIFSLSLVKEGNPLDVEKKLLQARWQYLEELEKEHDFDLSFLISYYLKLQILNHLNQFNKEEGMEIFENLIVVEPDVVFLKNETKSE